jgi:hypothetical protein
MVDDCPHDVLASWPGMKDEADRNGRRLEPREQRFEAFIGELIGNLIGEQAAYTVATHQAELERIAGIVSGADDIVAIKPALAKRPAGVVARIRNRAEFPILEMYCKLAVRCLDASEWRPGNTRLGSRCRPSFHLRP